MAAQTPRKAETYRAARRNHVLRKLKTVWSGGPKARHYYSEHKARYYAKYQPPVRANRSSKWAPIKGRLYAVGAR